MTAIGGLTFQQLDRLKWVTIREFEVGHGWIESEAVTGRSRNGHTFILLDKDGEILWRADYGGAPDYTMYVPVTNLVADLRQGLIKAQ